MSRSGSSTGNGAGCPTRRALSGRISHTSSVASMNASFEMVFSNGRPRVWRFLGLMARSKRPLPAMITRSVVSRSTGLAALANDPHAHDPTRPRP